MNYSISLLFLVFTNFTLQAAVIFDKPAIAPAAGFRSATGTICTAHFQQRIWDSFDLSAPGTIREIQWRGTYRSLSPAQFVVKIFNDPPGGVPGLTTPPLVSYVTVGSADETPLGTNYCSYRFVLPVPFSVVANKTYALQIYALQPGVPDWAWQQGAGNSHTVWKGTLQNLQDSSVGLAAGGASFSLHDAVTIPDAVIALTGSPATGGTVTGAGTFAQGAPVTVTAAPASGFTFLYWKEGGSVVSTMASYEFLAGAYRGLVAHFGSPNHSRINLTHFPPIAGRGAGAGTYSNGQQITLDVQISDGFAFYYWSQNGNIVSYDPNYTFTVSGDRNLEATYIIDYNQEPGTYVFLRTRSYPFNAGMLTGQGAWVGVSRNVTVRAVAAPGYRFKRWRDDVGFTSTSPTVTYQTGIGTTWLRADFDPVLTIVPDATPGDLRLFWPSGAGNWSLEESPDLSEGNWRPSARSILLLGDQNAVVMPAMETGRFFRLFHP